MTTNQTAKIEGTKLHQAATATGTANEVTLYLNDRQRMRSIFTNIDATERMLRNMGKKIVHAEYTQYWNSLEALGVGSIIRGRNGNPDRFEWSYNLREVAKAAIEGKDLTAPAIQAVHQARKVLKTGAKTVSKKRTKVISGQRKPGRPATVVSVNLSLNELETLQRILSKAKK